jgi:hypothetical protein
MTGITGADAPSRPTPLRVLVPFGIGAAVSVLLGVYAHVHDPTGEQVIELFFTSQIQLKVWFATVAFVLALYQLFSGMRLYGTLKFPKTIPSWFGQTHRLSGTLALAFTLPVGYHCLWSLGFQDTDGRVFLHSIFGCLFYGGFVAKVIIVRDHRLPGWTLPFVGSIVFTSLVVLFLTSSMWFFTNDPLNRPIF